MGIVYKARQRSLDRLVAVKFLLFGPHAGVEFIKRFRIEASAAAALQHPNIVAIHEVGVHEGEHFLVMDYVDGPNLAKLVREQPLPPKRAAQYLKTIAEAIHYAHEHGILHRDLKPSNVLIDANDQPRVTDFGLAKRLGTDSQPATQDVSQLTVSGQVMGSPGYMPPEQAGGARGKMSRRSDVYSLGAMLYHLLTGRPPFGGGSVAETLKQVETQEPVSLRLLNPSVPLDLETICLKCLVKEPEHRYGSAMELSEELSRFLADEPIHARPVSRSEKLWRWCLRKPALAVTAGTTSAAIAAATLFAVQLRHVEHRRVAEQRGAAMNSALLATRSGSLEEAEKAIAVAELAGVPAGELRLLHGQLAFHHSEYPEAIRHLEQAALLSPDSVAIQAILALAYDQVGEWNKSTRMIENVTRLSPKTPEDYLFKGWVEAEWDSVRGLATLEKALQLRPSAMALLLRADARANLADDYREVADAERASAEMDTVLDLLPANPVALSASLLTRLAAANTYADAGQTNGYEKAMAQAAVASEALKRFPQSIDAVKSRILYLKYVNDDAGVLHLLRETDPGTTFINYWHAAELYAGGDFEEAIRITTNAAASDYCRGYILAEQPNGAELALREFQRYWETEPPGWDAMNAQTILRLLGRRNEAVSACKSIRHRFSRWPAWRNGWYQRLVDYNCDLIGDEELLHVAGKSRWNQCEAHFHISMNLLADGRRDAARDHFRSAVALKIVSFYEDKWSRAFLRRMEQDTNWPPWIPINPQP